MSSSEHSTFDRVELLALRHGPIEILEPLHLEDLERHAVRKPLEIVERIKCLEQNISAGEVVEIPRELFGKGKLGHIAFTTIAEGIACEVSVGDNKCPNQAIMTVDYDMTGDASFKAVCSLSHASTIEEEVRSAGFRPYFGINGFGRIIEGDLERGNRC